MKHLRGKSRATLLAGLVVAAVAAALTAFPGVARAERTEDYDVDPELESLTADLIAGFQATPLGAAFSPPAVPTGSLNSLDRLELPVDDANALLFVVSDEQPSLLENDNTIVFPFSTDGSGVNSIVVRDFVTDPRDDRDLVRVDDFVNFIFSAAGQQIITDASLTPLDPPGSVPPLPDFDVDYSGDVGIGDISAVALNWDVDGPGIGWIRADIDNDGNIGLGDVSAIATRWDEVGVQIAEFTVGLTLPSGISFNVNDLNRDQDSVIPVSGLSITATIPWQLFVYDPVAQGRGHMRRSDQTLLIHPLRLQAIGFQEINLQVPPAPGTAGALVANGDGNIPATEEPVPIVLRQYVETEDAPGNFSITLRFTAISVF